MATGLHEGANTLVIVHPRRVEELTVKGRVHCASNQCTVPAGTSVVPIPTLLVLMAVTGLAKESE